MLPVVEVRQYICAGNSNLNHSNSATNTSSSGRSHHAGYSYRNISDDIWLEVGTVTFGPLVIESAISLPHLEQDVIQRKFVLLIYYLTFIIINFKVS